MKLTISTSIRRALIVCAPLLLLLLLSSIAAAEELAKPKSSEARARLSAGNTLYRMREFARAVEEYKAGMLLEDVPVFAYNLAQSYRQLRRYEEAIWHYERFLSRATPAAEMKAAIDGFLIEMKSELEKQRKAESEKAATFAPANAPVPAARPSGPWPRDVPVEERRGLSSRRKLAIAVGGAGLAAIATGVVLGARARSFDDDAAAICPATECVRADEANALIDRGKTNARYANVMFGVGGGLVVGAAVLWMTGRAAPTSTSTAVTPHVSNTSVGLSVSKAF